MSAVYHEGERRVQERAGEAHVAARTGRMIVDFLDDGLAAFLAQRSLGALTVPDGEGRPWVTPLFGEPGFLERESDQVLRVDLSRVAHDPTDPAVAELRPGARVGLLAIELSTRERVRVNGEVLETGLADGALRIRVAEVYGNCPKYIQARQFDVAVNDGGAPGEGVVVRGADLAREAIEILSSADTSFLGSLAPGGDADASHRGGRPGFLAVGESGLIRMPDFKGNGMYNSLGNLEIHPWAALAVLDFGGGRLLQLQAEARHRFTDPGEGDGTGGTGRVTELRVVAWRVVSFPVRLTVTALEASRFNP